MCGDYELELDYDLKCEMCGKKPAVNLVDPTGIEDTGLDYKALCENCGIEVFTEDIVSDWAGTKLYLEKYPEMAEVWG